MTIKIHPRILTMSTYIISLSLLSIDYFEINEELSHSGLNLMAL